MLWEFCGGVTTVQAVPYVTGPYSTELFGVGVRAASWRPVLAVLCLGIVVGCTIVQDPVSVEEREINAAADRESMFVDQEPINGPLTLFDAMARAIKYNLDHRMKALEEAVALRQVDVGSFDLLPKVVLNAGYTTRSEQNASVSRSIRTQLQSLEASTSQDRDLWRLDGTATWNMLDFGASYFEARQNGDRAHVARERTRKVVHNLIETVRFAYWRAAAAQQVEDKIEPALERAEQALMASQAVERENLQPILITLEYQKTLLEIVLRLESLRDELRFARLELVNLMNLEPGLLFILDVPEYLTLSTTVSELPVEELEALALISRPELFEADYKERIVVNEVHRSMLKMFPGLQLSVSRQYDSNSFTVNQNWIEAGARFSLNLIDMAAGPTALDLAKTSVEVAKAQRLALSMAILSQVRLAQQQNQSLLRQYYRSRNLNSIDERIEKHMKASMSASAESEIEEIRATVTAIFSRLGKYEAYALVQNSAGRLYASIGLDPLPKTIGDDNLASIAEALEWRFSQWAAGNLTVRGGPLAGDLPDDDVTAGDMTDSSNTADDFMLWLESLFG